MIKLWLSVLVLTGISWLVLKLIDKSIHVGLVFLFWTLIIFGSIAGFYGVSVWFAGF